MTSSESEGVMYLPEDDSDTFTMLVNYVYQKCAPPYPIERYPASEEGCSKYLDMAYSLFYLAEKICMDELSNIVMDKIQYMQFEHGEIPSANDIARIHENTCEGSSLRKYAVLMRLHVICTTEEK